METLEMEMTNKDKVLADESLFQRACGRMVSAWVGHCLSHLMYDIGRNLEEASKVFTDYSYDEMQGWFQSEDFEEPARQAGWDEIDDEIVKRAGELVPYPARGANKFDHYDVISEAGGPEEVNEELNLGIDFDDVEDDEMAVWQTLTDAQRGMLIDKYREAMQETADSWEDACSQDSLAPDIIEVYEHWIVDPWFASKLKQHGEITFEFGNLTIWGRTTTGQSISMDGVIREIAREQDPCSFIWHDE